MLPAAFLSPDDLIAGAGGLAAAIAIGAFVGQAVAVLISASAERRRTATAICGLIGCGLMIGLILLSVEAR